MKRYRSKLIKETVELNITAFLNLMVILVPFLLITAVFSRITVLELNLPLLNADNQQQQNIDLQLELIIREQVFEFRDARLGLIKSLPRANTQTNWQSLSTILLEIKNQFPEETAITLLLEPGIEYKTLIQVMDRVRSTTIVNITELETLELFPNVSIGDASLASSGGES